VPMQLLQQALRESSWSAISFGEVSRANAQTHKPMPRTRSKATVFVWVTHHTTIADPKDSVTTRTTAVVSLKLHFQGHSVARPDELPSYFAARCGGAPMTILREYMEQQKTPL
jgi:hypothetical protein